jgi:hypothetical protein
MSSFFGLFTVRCTRNLIRCLRVENKNCEPDLSRPSPGPSEASNVATKYREQNQFHKRANVRADDFNQSGGRKCVNLILAMEHSEEKLAVALLDAQKGPGHSPKVSIC